MFLDEAGKAVVSSVDEQIAVEDLDRVRHDLQELGDVTCEIQFRDRGPRQSGRLHDVGLVLGIHHGDDARLSGAVVDGAQRAVKLRAEADLVGDLDVNRGSGQVDGVLDVIGIIDVDGGDHPLEGAHVVVEIALEHTEAELVVQVDGDGTDRRSRGQVALDGKDESQGILDQSGVFDPQMEIRQVEGLPGAELVVLDLQGQALVIHYVGQDDLGEGIGRIDHVEEIAQIALGEFAVAEKHRARGIHQRNSQVDILPRDQLEAVHHGAGSEIDMPKVRRFGLAGIDQRENLVLADGDVQAVRQFGDQDALVHQRNGDIDIPGWHVRLGDVASAQPEQDRRQRGKPESHASLLVRKVAKYHFSISTPKIGPRTVMSRIFSHGRRLSLV